MRRRPLVKVKGKVYDANAWANYANAMAEYRDRMYRAQALAAYFQAIREAQQRQK